MRSQLRAVPVLQRTPHGREHRGEQRSRQAGVVFERIFHDAALLRELLLVREHLELAAGAGTEVLALDQRVVAVGGRSDDVEERGHREHVLVVPDLDLDGIAGEREGDAESAVLVHCEAVAGGREAGDCEFQRGLLFWQWRGRDGFVGDVERCEERFDVVLEGVLDGAFFEGFAPLGGALFLAGL